MGGQRKSRMLPDKGCLGSGRRFVRAVHDQYHCTAGHVVEGQEGCAYQGRGLKVCMLSSSRDGSECSTDLV